MVLMVVFFSTPNEFSMGVIETSPQAIFHREILLEYFSKDTFSNFFPSLLAQYRVIFYEEFFVLIEFQTRSNSFPSNEVSSSCFLKNKTSLNID